MTSPINRGIHRENYEPNKTYPILVKIQNAGYHKIVEMEGWKVNEYNSMVRESNETKTRNFY
jgi:hypothetical protein